MLSVLRLHVRAFGSWMLAGTVLTGAMLGVQVGGTAETASFGSGPHRSAIERASSLPSDATTPEIDGQDAEEVELVVSPREPVIAAGDSEVQFGVLIRNPTAAELPAGTVTLELDERRLTDPEDLDEPLPATATRFAEATVEPTAPGSEQTATVTVSRSDLPVDVAAEAGAYRVGATLQFAEAPEQGFAAFGAEPAEDDGTAAITVSTTTPVVWKGAGAESVPLSIIVPFVLPSDIRTLPTRAQLEELAPAWDRLLTAARVHEATLAIDPRLIAGIRAYGDEAPRNAQLLLSRLEATPLPSFLLQFADADPSVQAALGFTTLLEPTNLDFASRFGSFSETPDGSEPATDESDAEGEREDAESPAVGDADVDGSAGSAELPLPTLSELLDWPQQEAAHAWPAEGRADPALLPLLDQEGIDALLLSSDGVVLDGGPRGRLDSASESDDVTVTVTDADLDRAARTMLRAETETERSGGAARLAAELVVDAQGGSDGVVLALDRGATGDATDPAALLEQLEAFVWTTPTAIADQRSGTVELRLAGAVQDRLELLRSASNREGSVNELGAVLTHPEYLSGYQRTRLLQLFSTQYAADVEGFALVAADFRERDAELLSGVQAISTEHIQLVGSSSRVPVQLRNALPFDAVVTVDVDPASAALSVPERRFGAVVVPAETSERVLVPVRSRVSSAESGLVVSVSAAAGSPTVFTGTLPITVRSSIETIIFWALGGFAVMLLVFGIVRSVGRRRSRNPSGAGMGGGDEDAVPAM